jgi:cardiolipin synthase
LERRSPVSTLAWFFCLAWLPVVGIAVYLLIGPRRLKRKKLRYRRVKSHLAEAHRKARAGEGSAAEAAQIADWRPLMNLGERTGQEPPVRARRVEMFTSGDACFAAIEEAILASRHHVHMEYYIWEPDTVGKRFAKLLAAKAEEGVQVRLLVDDIGSARLGRRFLQELRESGVEAALFNPMSMARFRPDLVNFRTHRKIVVCDGSVGFIGGMNICDAHSSSVWGTKAWRDTHMRIDGPPVSELQLAFLEDWHFATGSGPTSPVYLPERGDKASGPWVQILSSGPDSDHHAIEKFCFSAIAAARRRVMITTPYFVPGEPLLSALTTAALRGVKVQLLLPVRSDQPLVAAAARSYYEELARTGVQVFEYGPNMLHAKVLVVDDDISLVGTANMDNRSFRLNFEIAAAVYDSEVAERLADSFHHDLADAKMFRLSEVPRHGWLRKLCESTARLFSPML